MSGNDLVVSVNNDGVDEAKLPDTCFELALLTLGMCPRITRIGLEDRNWQVLYYQLRIPSWTVQIDTARVVASLGCIFHATRLRDLFPVNNPARLRPDELGQNAVSKLSISCDLRFTRNIFVVK